MYFFPFFFSCVKSDTHLLSCALAGNCDVCGIRITTTVCDITMMYCQEQYMENVPSLLSVSFNPSIVTSLSVINPIVPKYHF